MKRKGIGIKSLSVKFPKEVRNNDFYINKYPDVIKKIEEKTLSKMFSSNSSKEENQNIYNKCLIPYLSDPFRGTIERRVLSKNESSRDLEFQAAKDAIKLSNIDIGDIDALISAAFIPETLGAGNAAYLCRDLNLNCSGWNLESACSSSVIALQNAYCLVKSGEYKNVLVTTSCTYSKMNEESDTLSWFVGDGAAAFIIGELPEDYGIISNSSISTGKTTCDSFYLELSKNNNNEPWIKMGAKENTGKIISDISESLVRNVCDKILNKSGLSVEDIDYYVINTPVAWYADFFAKVMDVNPDKVINVFPKYGNIGPVLVPANLNQAISDNIKNGDIVLIYAFATVATAASTVMRYNNISIG